MFANTTLFPEENLSVRNAGSKDQPPKCFDRLEGRGEEGRAIQKENRRAEQLMMICRSAGGRSLLTAFLLGMAVVRTQSALQQFPDGHLL